MHKAKRRIQFTEDEEILSVTLAQFGRSNAYISEMTGLTDGQVQYRLTLAKNREGFGSGQGYRTAWRDGTSPVARMIERKFLGIFQRRVRKRLVPKFAA